MEMNMILKQRKELKKRSHQVVRSHYVILTFLILLMILFGTEFILPKEALRTNYSAFTGEKKNPGSAEEDEASDSSPKSESVWKSIISGNMDKGVETADILSKRLLENSKGSSTFGRTDGVLAMLVNGLSTGTLLSQVAKVVRSVVKSDEIVAWVFIIVNILWYVLIYIFIRNVFSAIMRRVFLQARVYEKIFFPDILHFAAVRKWFQASFTMGVMMVYEFLWTLTIVGGIIKYYSYWAVPFIVAENPSVSANEAVTLSRKMMDGHKMEVFKCQLSMIGWILLGAVTFGLFDLFYGGAYRMAFYSEVYAKIREDAIRNHVEGCEVLDDKYLFRKADKILLYETYFEVVDEITVVHENRITLAGAKKIAAEWFGIWLGNLDDKKKYEEQEGRLFTIENYRHSMDGLTYPNWLNPRWRQKEMEKQGSFTFLRSYSIWTLFLLFICFSFIGWSWEVGLHFVQTGEFANRGTMFGPWLPIYGSGGVVVLILCSRFRKKPVLEFITAVILCGIIEYFSAWALEKKFHKRWWSYDGYFLNLHGRICAEGLLVFGVGCCAVVYFFAPLFDYWLSKLQKTILIPICIVLAVLFAVDYVHASIHPNVSAGAAESIPADKSPKPPE